MADKFQTGDRVFAKIKGWPPWPAKVLNRAEGKTEAYLIQFYGTYDVSVVKPDSIYVYNDESKAKYGKPKSSQRWKEAMEEIENNTPIGENGPLEEEEEAAGPMEVDHDTDNDGELMIDEGPSQPPVLTKEGGKANNQNGKPEPPKGRRGSKASLSKRDSISSTSSIPEPTTPAAGTPPATEMVSRSGRKIKPKRFADDEISTTPAATKNKASSQDDEGPPSKRPKRGGKTPPASKATATPPPVEPKEPAVRPRMVVGKGKGAPTKTPSTPVSSGRVSPDISSPVPKVPALKPAAAPVATRKSEALSQQGGKKPLPALIPASGTASTAAPVLPQQVDPTPPTRRAPALRQQARQEVITDEDDLENDVPPMLAINTDGTEADDKENLKESSASTNGSEGDGESESEMEKNSEIDETSSRYSEVLDENLTKIPFVDRDGEQFELRVETKQEFETEEERIEYENTVSAIVKIKEDIEQGEQDTHDTLQELFEANREDFESEEDIKRERRACQIRTLRVEGEVIEIIGEIVNCLGEKQADCYRALELLDRLGSHDLTALILKKHPEVVQTVGRLRNYVGNAEQWDMTEDQLLEFKESASAIRKQASEIYSSFYSVFIPPEEQDQTVPFEEIFKEEMKVFKEMTQDLTMDEILGLTAETEGGFEMFDAGEIEA